ncbi:MAG: fibronectin type III domain-containing protein [Firmicutes bacterium]|nr:fibronectin type III domain-containing protein [Bacillota bacterium]
MGKSKERIWIKMIRPCFIVLPLIFMLATVLSGCGGGSAGSAPAAPGKPVVNAGIQKLTVTWEAVEGATEYAVYYNTENNNKDLQPYTGDQNKEDTSCVITGLSSYSFCIVII